MDRRQRKTRKAIYQAFEELVSEGHYAQVTVGQIIERADIGRSTFYAHFPTKDALLEQMCSELFAHVFDGVETGEHTHEPQPPALEGTLAHLLCHLRDDHQGVCGKLLAQGEPHFGALFDEQLKLVVVDQLPERSSWVPRDLLLALVVGGFREAFIWWHNQGYEVAPADVAHWYLRTFGWPVQTHH